MTTPDIEVEVVYALPLIQEVTRLRLPSGATVAEALERAAVRARHPEADVRRVAILGRAVTPETVLCDLDRVEVLRPLTVDPKEARRLRAAERRLRNIRSGD